MVKMDQLQSYMKKQAEEELYENIWPEWVVKEGKIDQAKSLLGRMYEVLEHKEDPRSAEKVFSLFDNRDKGLTSIDDFKKVL